MSTILAKLFDSADRIKLIRLFLLNPEEVLTAKEISERAKILPQPLRKEINLLFGINFICRKKRAKNTPIKKKSARGGPISGRKKIDGWSLDPSFPLLTPLKDLVLDTTPLSREEFLKKIMRAGKINLVVLAGIFIQEDNSRVDVLVVGDKIKREMVEKVLKTTESEVGKELAYAIFSTEDFIYRVNICDKFVRDILDYPHQKIFNKLNLV